MQKLFKRKSFRNLYTKEYLFVVYKNNKCMIFFFPNINVQYFIYKKKQLYEFGTHNGNIHLHI